SPRNTSVSTQADGTNMRRPPSSARVGSTIGSGWKLAIAHEKPQARGSGAKYRPARAHSVSPCTTTWTRLSACARKRYGSRPVRCSLPSSSRTPAVKLWREPTRGGMVRVLPELFGRHPGVEDLLAGHGGGGA